MLHTFVFKKLCYCHTLGMLQFQTQKILVSCKDNIYISHNSSISFFLSITYFIDKCLYIILIGNAHDLGRPRKSSLRFVNSLRRCIA